MPGGQLKLSLALASSFLKIINIILKTIIMNMGRPNFTEEEIQRLKSCIGDKAFLNINYLFENPYQNTKIHTFVDMAQLVDHFFMLGMSIYELVTGSVTISNEPITFYVIMIIILQLAFILFDVKKAIQAYATPKPSEIFKLNELL